MNFANLSFALVTLLAAVGVDGVRIDVDTSAASDLNNFGSKVKATLEDWFPYLSSKLESPNYSPPQVIPIYFDPNYDGVAYAAGGRIVGAVNYYRTHQDDVGSMIHEMVHIIQSYKSGPGWLTEGIADYWRYWHYEPNRKPGKPSGSQHYTNGYGVAAYFLNFVESRFNGMLYYLNKDSREGTYNDNIWPRLTGKTVDQHWEDMKREG